MTLAIEEENPGKVKVMMETPEEIRTGQSRPSLWRGMTVFYRTDPHCQCPRDAPYGPGDRQALETLMKEAVHYRWSPDCERRAISMSSGARLSASLRTGRSSRRRSARC